MPGVRKLKQFFRQVIRLYAPESFVEFVRKKRRIKRLNAIRSSAADFNLDSFREALQSIGIRRDGYLFVHSGSDYFTLVEGGLFAVLKDLLEIMKDGTILMPAFPFDGMAGEYLEKEQFSCKKSPSKMGLITELFRRTSGVKRSLHPTHSVCALGKNDDYLIRDHLSSPYPFDKNSPFGRLIELDGQILMIGVGLEILTLIHCIEDEMKDRFPLAVYSPKPFQVTLTDMEGQEIQMETFAHNPKVSIRKNIPQIEDELVKIGLLEKLMISNVEIRLLEARGLHEFLREKALAGKTIYDTV